MMMSMRFPQIVRAPFKSGTTTTVNAHDFAAVMERRLAKIGNTRAGLERSAGLPKDAIRNVFRGHPPTLPRAAEICAALGLEFYIGEPRADFATVISPPVSPVLPIGRAARRGLDPVSDRRLAEILAAICAHYDSLGNDYAREHFLADLWAAGGSGLRAQGSRASSPGSDGR